MRYHLLDTLGVSLWMQRQESASLILHPPLMCAPCLVLLPYKLEENSEEKKIFTGMLSVLKLGKEQLTIAWAKKPLEKNCSLAIGQFIKHWLPYTILIMGEAFAQTLLNSEMSMEKMRKDIHTLPSSNAWVQMTYHPRELQIDPKNKSKAYQDLLCLKQQLLRETL